MIYRCVLAQWAQNEFPDLPKVYEGEFDDQYIASLNARFYHIYYLPNQPSHYDKSHLLRGDDIDQFNYVFVDMDLKKGKYESKEAFLKELSAFPLMPTRIHDSGNGIHAYWSVSDLDAMTYLKLQRRLIRALKTDEAVGQIFQLMRLVNTKNWKDKETPKLCRPISVFDRSYTAEELDSVLPKLTLVDEKYCQRHYDATYNKDSTKNNNIVHELPVKFLTFLEKNAEAKELWTTPTSDRSKADFRLGHLLHNFHFSRDEALLVLSNTQKALTRAPQHRITYAQNIIDKIWAPEEEEDASRQIIVDLSSSVADILAKNSDDDALRGTRFPCYDFFDSTEHGFRLGQVIGLVGGSGVGKTSVALNMFMGFVQNNPDYIHFFVPLEQPPHEIALRWKKMCGDKTYLHKKVHIMNNYDATGNYRNLSLKEIKNYLLQYQILTGHKIGCVVIDHIGLLKKENPRSGELQGLIDVCHQMKAFAVQTNTMLVMQSQAPREKAGIGDLELNKDAAYGTMLFESYCDYLITAWQPLKRVYQEEGCPYVTAYKFCKIRHKCQGKDRIMEDVRLCLIFNPDTETFRPMTAREEKAFPTFNSMATNLRKQDRKTDLLTYSSLPQSTPPGKDMSNA